MVVSVLEARDLTEEDRSDFEQCRHLQEEGDWQEARKVARELVNRFAGDVPTKPALVFSIELANLNQRLGNYDLALDRYRFCLQVAIELEGEESKTVAQIKNNLAALLQVLGEFEEAGELNREALATREAIEGKGAPGTVPAKNNLAGLLWCIGDLAAAEGLYREGLSIREAALGADALDTGRSLANLAGLLFYRGEIAEAGELATRAVQIFKQEAGPAHPDTLEALLFYGDLERAAGRAKRAEQAYEEVLRGREKAFSTRDHAEVAEALRRLGDARREQGLNDGARQSYRESDRRYLAVLPSQHPDRLEGLYGLGLAALADGDRDTARLAARQCAEIEFSQFDAMLKYTDERQRLAYQDIFRSQHLYAALGDARALAEFLMRQKGVVSDSLIHEARLSRQSSDPEVIVMQKLLSAKRAEYRAAYLGAAPTSGSLEELDFEVRALKQKILGAVSTGGDLTGFPPISLEEVQGKLNRTEVFLDYFKFQRDEGGGKFEERIGVVALSRNEVHFADCCAAKEAESVISAMVAYFGSGIPGDNSEEVSRATMEKLYSLLLAPASEWTGAAEGVIVSPEGALSFVPFACLIGPGGRFLIEDADLRYFSSAREVVRNELENRSSGPVVLVGNPDFQMNLQKLPEEADRRGFLATLKAQDLSSMAELIAPLAGAEEEVKLLSPLIKERLGFEVRSFIGTAATESTLREELIRPLAVHFATHGIYLPKILSPLSDFPTDSPFIPQEVAGFQNPMFGSWLALAGSGRTVGAWAIGAVPDPETDGILMANEAADLDLEGTLLVTLSACDTASGEATTGDGVLGLRRGFRLAGAQNILSTLWPISDAATVAIMQEFYGGLENSTPAASLSKTQREWLVRIRENSSSTPNGPIPVGGTFYAIYLAGPFLLGR